MKKKNTLFTLSILILLAFLISISMLKKTTVVEKTNIATSTSEVVSNHFVCLGEKDPYYNLGFGVTHIYEGKITQNLPVLVTLSCDHQEFVISGSVSQTLRSDDLKEYYQGETIELVDTSILNSGVGLDKDYNFDGYNDLTAVTNYGQGYEGVITYAVFLFNPTKKLFIYSSELSSITNLGEPDNASKQITSKNCYFNNERTQLSCDTVYYKWKENNLIKEKTITKVEK